MFRIFIAILIAVIFISCQSIEEKTANEFSEFKIDSTKISKLSYDYLNEFSISPPKNWHRVISKYESKKISLNQSGKASSYLIMKTLDLFNAQGANKIMSISSIEADSTDNNILKSYIDFAKFKFNNDDIKIDEFVNRGRNTYVLKINKSNIMSIRFLFLSSQGKIFQVEFTCEPNEYDSVIEYIKSSIASIKFL